MQVDGIIMLTFGHPPTGGRGTDVVQKVKVVFAGLWVCQPYVSRALAAQQQPQQHPQLTTIPASHLLRLPHPLVVTTVAFVFFFLFSFVLCRGGC